MIIGCSRVGVHRSYLVVAVGLSRIGVAPRLRDRRGRWLSAHSVIDSISRLDDEIESRSAPARTVARRARVVLTLLLAVVTAATRAPWYASLLKLWRLAWLYTVTPPKRWAVYGVDS